MKVPKVLIFVLAIIILTSIAFSIRDKTQVDCRHADVNKDSIVNALDFSYVRLYLFGQQDCSKKNKWCSQGDQNMDGYVDGQDLAVLLEFFGDECPLASQIVINEFVVDPEQDWDNSGTTNQGSDEWFELYNKGKKSIDLTGWTLYLIDTTPELEKLSGVINPGEHKVILNPAGTQNIDGRIELIDNQGDLIDSVSYGDFDDGNVDDNAPSGSAQGVKNECLARDPDGQDTDQDDLDFIKTECTYGVSNS